MSILAQLPDVSGYVSHKLLSLETLSWLDGYVFRHVRKPSSGLVMPVGVWWPWHIIYLFMYLFIYLYIYIAHENVQPNSQTNQRASTISPRSQLESPCLPADMCIYIYHFAPFFHHPLGLL